MAVLGRLLISSAERLDLPDLLSIDSYGAGDWRYFLNGLVGPTKPYVLKGFDVIDPQNAIGTQSCSIRVADSIVLYPGSNAGPFYHGLSEGNPNALPLIPELRKNAVNYVYLTFSTFNTSIDTRAFWDPDKDGGVGGEFTQDVNTESVLKVEVNVSTGSFPSNTIPIAKITVGAVVITAIEDARDLMFRLGTGGINPNPNNNYNFRSLPSSTYKRLEPPTIMSNPSDPNPFQGADKNIYSLKEWMDVVMTKLKELGGTPAWYDDVSSFSLTNLFYNVMATTFKSKGQYVHSAVSPGDLTWTEDVIIKSTASPQDITIRAGSIHLDNEQVAWLNLIKNQPFNSFDQSVTWTNGQNYINTVGGAIGHFANLSKGDWVKSINDDVVNFLQVQEFYDAVNLGGSVTTAANARSVRLSGNYLGVTIVEKGRYDKGIYLDSDLIISDRNDPAIAAAGGNFFWLVSRSDTILNIASISAVEVSGTLSLVDAGAAQVVATAHGLVDGDRITVTAPAGQAGTYTVDIVDANTFFIPTTNTSVGAFTGFYGLATTAARTDGFGNQIESANHGFESGDIVTIAGTVNFNGSYVINRRSSTQFEFPFGSAPVVPGSVTLATAATYAVLASSTITNTGNSVLTGDLGLSPGTSVVGFPPGTVSGTQHVANAAAVQAQIDAQAAYTYLAGLTPDANVSGVDLGTLTLLPGVYQYNTSAQLTGTLTLDAAGDPNALWVFQIGSTLTTASSSVVNIINGGSAANVYWQVGSSATLGTSTTFKGTIIAQASITAVTSATVSGRLLALTGAVTLDTNTVAITAGGGGGAPVVETTGTATLVRLDIRSENGITKVVQGETIDIGEGASENLKNFIGMDSITETHPVYYIPAGQNTLYGMANFNSDPLDNLTRRVSKLTAMMADRAQDRDSQLLNRVTIRNTTSGSNQVITASGTMILEKPGSPQQVVNLGCTLPVNSTAVMEIDRNTGAAINLVVKGIDAEFPVSENGVVVFYRLADTTVHTWEGAKIPAHGAFTTNNPEDAQSKNIVISNPGRMHFDIGTEVLTFSDPTEDVQIVVPGTTAINTLDVSVLNGLGTMIMPANSSAWARIDRVNDKVFDQIATSDIAEIGSGVVYITLTSAVAVDQDVVVLFSRVGDNILESKIGTPPNQNIYVEELTVVSGAPANSNEVTGPISIGGQIFLPLDSRDSSSVREYVVGSGMLQIFLNGQELVEGEDWLPYGAPGTLSTSILTQQSIVVGDRFDFRIDSQSGVWIAAGGGGGGGGVPIGPNKSIQFNDAGAFNGDSDLTWDSATSELGLGVAKIATLVSTAIADNQVSPTSIITYQASDHPFAIIEYSVQRGTIYEVGQMLVSNNGATTGFNTTSVYTSPSGVSFTAGISGLNVVITYTSTSTGVAATLKYSIKYWM